MFFRDQHQNSILQKSLVTTGLLVSFIASIDILFGNRTGFDLWSNPYRTNGNLVRDGMLLACFAIYILRVLATLFVFFRRVMFWREALIIVNIMPWCFVTAAYFAGQQTEPIGLVEVVGAGLYLLGSYLNSASEYARHLWKMDPANAEHLYTQGLFTHVRHVNYSGDVLLFTGIALVADQLGLLLIPLSMFLFFLLVLIPLKERHLRERYGRAFDAYAARTKKLIPLIV